MSDLVARTGRHQQRYEKGCRLIAGCIPYRYKNGDEFDSTNPKGTVEVLMINSQSGPGLLFPKGGWENDETDEEAAEREAVEEAGVRGVIKSKLGDYDFKSKTLQDEFCPEGSCKAAMFALLVEEELSSWPEHETRSRSWLCIDDAKEQCRHDWMRRALEGFLDWHDFVTSDPEEEPDTGAESPTRGGGRKKRMKKTKEKGKNQGKNGEKEGNKRERGEEERKMMERKKRRKI